MDKSKKTVQNWQKWCQFVKEVLPDQKFDVKFAAHQWKLYWSGERGGELSDLAIHLIDNYGYK